MSDDSALSTQRRRGRRPGVSGTRQAILEAARARFAVDGYVGTTVRKIAADAEVDPSLVFRFFQSKEELFAAALSIPPAALEQFAKAFEAPAHVLGETVTRAFLEIWDTGTSDSQPLLAMIRAAVANEQATEQLRGFIEARLVEEGHSSTGDRPHARERAGLAASMLVGIIVGRRIVQVPTLVAMDRETLVQIVAPAIQAALVEAAPRPTR